MGLKVEGLRDGDTEGLGDESSALGVIWGVESEAEGADSEVEDRDDEEDKGNWLDQFTAAQTALPRVTKLTPGVRDPNRVNVFLDGRFAFSLDVAQVVELGVKVDQELSPERLKELRDASEFGKLYQRTLEWVLTRPHSVRETRDYLRRRQIKRHQLNRQREREEKKPLAELRDDMMELVVERLITKGYLNDEKFAAYYIENRYVRRGISHKRLRMELQKKGVDTDIVNRLLNQEARDEDEEIMKMIAKKRKKYDDYKLVNYLVRQGFGFQMAKEAVEKYSNEES